MTQISKVTAVVSHCQKFPIARNETTKNGTNTLIGGVIVLTGFAPQAGYINVLKLHPNVITTLEAKIKMSIDDVPYGSTIILTVEQREAGTPYKVKMPDGSMVEKVYGETYYHVMPDFIVTQTSGLATGDLFAQASRAMLPSRPTKVVNDEVHEPDQTELLQAKVASLQLKAGIAEKNLKSLKKANSGATPEQVAEAEAQFNAIVAELTALEG
jgi:hypothetical protein